MLIISKVFTILSTHSLCRNKEYPGNFQKKTVISKLFFQNSAQVKWEGRPSWSGQEVMLTIIKVFIILIILFLLCLWEQGITWKFSKQSVNSPFNWFSRYILFLSKLKGKERPFLEGCKKGDPIARLSLGWYERWKRLSYCEIWNNPTLTLLCFLLDPFTNLQISTAGHGGLW